VKDFRQPHDRSHSQDDHGACKRCTGARIVITPSPPDAIV
jgi:hypothetical protein